MKYMLFTTILVFSFTITIAQKMHQPGEFVLTGKVIGQETGYVHIYYINSHEERIHDSCLLSKEGFIFKGSISEPSRAFFHGNRISQRASDPNATDIYLEPTAMQAVFEINNFKHGKITGSSTNDENTAWEKEHAELDSLTWRSFWHAYNDAKAKKETVKANALWNENIGRCRIDHSVIDYRFIKQHPFSYISAIILLNTNLTLDTTKMYFVMLSQEVKQSRNGKIINEKIRLAESVVIDNIAPDFTQTDVNGKLVSLSDFRGKYVLLEFWASWCIPCREQNPAFLKLYTQYKNSNFSIIGISLDSNEQKEAWIAAIKKDGLSWPQLSDLKGRENAVAVKYNVQPIPDNFLIDPNGKIIAKELYGETLEKKLKELLK